MKQYFYNLGEEKLFLVAYSLWLVDAIMGITMWRKIPFIGDLGDCLQKAAYLLLVVQFFIRKRYTRRDVVGVFLIIFSGILAYHSVYNRHIIVTMILVYMSANVDYRKILKCTLLIQGFLMVVTILASQLDVIEDVLWTQEGERMRQSLGYDYCAYPAHLLLFLTLIWFGLREKTQIIDIILFFLLNTAIYLATDARADYCLSLIAMSGFCMISRKRSNARHRVLEFWMKYGCGILAVFSIWIQYIYNADNVVMKQLNDALSNRLLLGKQAIECYGFSFFGRVIHWFGQGSVRNNPTLVYNYVDCAFLKELLSFGIVFLLGLIVAFYFVGKKLVEEESYVLGWALIISFLYSVMNAHLCMAVYNVFILLVGKLFRSEQCPIGDGVGRGQYGFLFQMKEIAESCLTENGKSVLRTALLWFLLIIATCVQRTGTNQMVSSASIYRWILCGILFLLAGLVYEGELAKKKNKSILLYSVAVYLVLAMMSDLFINKKFQYAAFALSIFGGMLVIACSSMKHMDKMIKEFKIAYKMYFVIVLLGGVISGRSIFGFCNNSLFLSAAENGIVMLVAMVIFLDDIQKKWSCIYNVGGVVTAICVLYTTNQKVLLLTGGCIGMVWLAVLIYKHLNNKYEKIGSVLLTVSVSMGCVTLGLWFLCKWHPENYFGVLKVYLKQVNILGHNYVPKYQNARVWTESGCMMNLYRYGALAGVAYLIMEISYFITACHQMLRTKNFLPMGFAIAVLVVNETVAVEFPFVHVGWILLILGVGYKVADGINEFSNRE